MKKKKSGKNNLKTKKIVFGEKSWLNLVDSFLLFLYNLIEVKKKNQAEL